MKETTLCITGGFSGIGAEVLKLAILNNWIVTAVVRTEDQKSTLEKKYPKNLTAIVCDLSKKDEVSYLIDSIKNESFTYVFLNAGIARYGHFSTLSADTIEDQLQVNLVSNIYITKALLPIASQSNTKFIYTSSIAARWPSTNYTMYGVSKAALSAFVRNISTEYPHLKFLCLEIGGVKTSIHKKADMNVDTSNYPSAVEIGTSIFTAIQNKTGTHGIKFSWSILRQMLMTFEDLIFFMKKKKNET